MNKDSHNFNCTVLTYLNLDIIGVCETFLKNGETLNLNGYHWFGNNRTSLHQNARRGSGGVGAFVKTEILEQYMCATDESMEDVIWLKFENRQTGHKFTVCICYLRPEGSSRKCDGEAFYSDLMLKFYDYQNNGDVIICGDFNSRCGDESDYIEGVDSIPPREVIDDKMNPYGQLLIDFLIDCNLCMLNGRTGENNFTNINVSGSSVVDYMIVPHEQLERYKEFKVPVNSS